MNFALGAHTKMDDSLRIAPVESLRLAKEELIDFVVQHWRRDRCEFRPVSYPYPTSFCLTHY